MRVFLTTVVRGAPLPRAGEVVILDWERKQVLHRTPIYPVDPGIDDPNTRGGGRGGRGMALTPTEVFATSYHTIHVYDHQLKPLRTITNRNFAGLHEIKLVKDGIWVSCTALGCVLKVDFTGQTIAEWWAHEDPVIQQHFQPAPLVVDKSKDNRLAYLENFSKVHLNNVEVFNDRVYVSFNNHGAVIRLFPTEVVAEDPALKGCHNGLVTEDNELILNDSHHHTVVVFDLATGKIKRRINLGEFPEVDALARASEFKDVSLRVRVTNFILRKRMARPLFTRGMCRLDESRILVGVSPASVLEVNYKTGKLLGHMSLSKSPNECIHGLEAAPSTDFAWS